MKKQSGACVTPLSQAFAAGSHAVARYLTLKQKGTTPPISTAATVHGERNGRKLILFRFTAPRNDRGAITDYLRNDRGAIHDELIQLAFTLAASQMAL